MAGKDTSVLDSIAINHTERNYKKVSAIILKPDAERMIQIKVGSLKEGLFTGFVTVEATIPARDVESLYLAPLHRLS